MSKVLERYRQSCYSSQDNVAENETHNLYQEASRLKVKQESLQRSYRHLLGEDLEMLRLKELLILEKQLDRTLSKTRQQKTRMMYNQLEELAQKITRIINQFPKKKATTDQGKDHGGREQLQA